MRLLSIVLSILIFWGCSSQLQDSVTNLEGCKTIKTALDEVCKGAEAIDWLNCDFMPGCPGGKVGEESVKVCKNKIIVSPTCQSAKDVKCSIEKLDCGPPSEEFEKPVGFDTACVKILNAINTFSDDVCSAIQASECNRFLAGCTDGVFEDDDVMNCINEAKESPDCNSAISSLETCTVRNKYCLP